MTRYAAPERRAVDLPPLNFYRFADICSLRKGATDCPNLQRVASAICRVSGGPGNAY